MIKYCRKIFLLILLIFLFWHETASAIEVQCEYIPRDSSGKIIYFEGRDAEHRPWSKKIEEAECLAKCNRESVTSLMSDCESWRGPVQNPDGCDVSRTSCGPVINPILTVNCKFTPRNPAGSALADAWEILTPSESECQNICADSMVLCSALCGTIMDDRCCDGTKTTCEATNIATDISSSSTPHQFDSVTPKLQIPLPTLPSFSEFTDLTLQGEVPNRYLWIPWIGQYIAAIYKYAIGIVGVLAGIMIVVGGLLWLTAGGSAERVSTAKSFIESSLVGLVIALTSYLLLYVINPNLVGFESLKVKYIERVPLDTILRNTLVDTAAPEGGTVSSVPTFFPDCPFTLTSNPENLPDISLCSNQRNKDFFNKINSVITASTQRERVVQTAQAVLKCGMSLGSCGKVRETILALSKAKIKQTHALSPSQISYLGSIRCPADQNNSTCWNQAIKKAYDKLKSEMSPDWPDSWANELQPGDGIVIYNANSEYPGGHAAIFLGWESANKAKVIQGRWGRLASEGSICIKNGCNPPKPLMRVYKVQDDPSTTETNFDEWCKRGWDWEP